ncbi:TonB-dependent siderophore receptor [Aquabacterium sp. A7-Y]|uniref:TonB-dependent siderophore receptor n=1 Tax=Aquabacterium sp. A7-Y TaxID=1349605 RepID=UPI00223D1A57|nr:TonB-dependent siderophore receptor [Aquabacterium sp. A7-Y]MCW7536438.1 TonB-dependent siderophore receptor [Aquabacterium sp. A7-Y]
MASIPRLGLVAATVLHACAWSVHAQESATPAASDPTQLPELRVRSNAMQETATGPVGGYRATRSATATRTDTPLKEVPQSVSVIGAEQIRDQNAQTLQEVLRYTAGVHAEVYGLDNRGDWFTMRGGSEGSTLLDGLRLPLSGWYGVVRNEPYAFERVEVLRGPASVMAGQNGPGGLVNLVSKRPQPEAQREISVQLGNHQHQQLAADLTGPVDAEGRLLYRLVALTRDSGTQVEYADMERQYVAPSLTWKPTPGTHFTAYLQYQRDRSRNTEGFFPVEGTLHDRPGGRIPLERFVSEPDWDTYGGRRWRTGWELEHRLDEAWTLRHHLRHDDVEGALRSMYANYWEGYRPDGRNIGRTWYASDDEGRITNADLMLEGRLRIGGVQHTLLTGVDAMNARSSRRYWVGAANDIDVYHPVYGNFPHPELTPATMDEPSSGSSRVRQYGLLLQDQMKFGERWVVVLGLRRDRAKTTSSQAGNSSSDVAWTKNLGVVYLADGGWAPYASYGESFEPVAGFNEAGSFRPKRGKQFEAGVKWAPDDRPVTATAALYTLRETNRKMDDPEDTGSREIQRGEVTVKGLELSFNGRLQAWDLVANYTRTETRDRSTGKRLPNEPEQSASVWAVHRFDHLGLRGVKAGLGVRHIGKTWDGSDTFTTPSATLLDAMAAWNTGSWVYALNIGNLADKTYLVACQERGDCWYGTRRKIVATASYRF